MHRLSAVLLGICTLFWAVSVTAEPRSLIGFGRLVNNDMLGDFNDRWRTGSLSSSRVYGPEWAGRLPSTFGEILELRLQGEAIAPANLIAPRAGDRPYVGAWSLGLHTHFDMRGFETALGADVVMTGPQTRMDKLHSALHRSLGVAGPSAATRAGQIGNRIHVSPVFEIGRDVPLGGTGARFRTFFEARAGVETLVRAGVDVTVGTVGLGELLVRDPVTGHRYRSVQGAARGLTWVFGADIAHVANSAYLPASRGYNVMDTRKRLRAGLHWQGENNAVFYGLTYLDEEFVGQGEGQVVGSLRLDLKF